MGVKGGSKRGLSEHLMKHVSLGVRAANLVQVVLYGVEKLDHLSVLARVEVAYGVIEVHA